MQIVPAIHSNYPRVGDTPDAQKLRRAIHRWERQEISDAELRQVEDEVVRDVIDEQGRAGLRVVSDGMIRWYCPFSYLARKLRSVEIDGLLRYFDTNFYFRQPVVRGPIQWVEPILLRDFAYAQSLTSLPVKVVLTGPYTMARYSIVETTVYTGRIERLTEDYAIAWSREIERLQSAGARWIQIEEPALLRFPGDAGIVRDALAVLADRRGHARLALALYWGNVVPLWEQLLSWPVDMLVVDFTYSPQLMDVICATGTVPKALGLGLFDGRNTKLEDPDAVRRQLDSLVPHLADTEHHLTTSCGIELLPRDRAYAKIERVARVARLWQGEET